MPALKKQRLPHRHFEISKEQIQEALEATHGNLLAASRLFQYKDGKKVPFQTFYSACKRLGVNHIAEAVKVRLAHEALDTLYKAATKGREWKAAVEILNRFGQLAGMQLAPKRIDQTLTVNPVDELMMEIDPDYKHLTMNSERNLPPNERSFEQS